MADWAVIVAAFYSMTLSLWCVIPAAFLIGSRQQAFGVLGHEASHRTACNSRWLNDVLGAITYAPLWLSFPKYREFHLSHHTHLGTELDPEVQLRKIMPNYTYATPKVFLDLFGFAIRDAVYFSKYLKPEWYVIAFQAVAATTLTFNGLLWVYLVWNVCLFTTHWFLFRIRAWGEHRGTSTLTVKWPRLVRELITPHNIWLHWEHHADPTIPFYRLELRPGAKAMALRTLVAR